jgi:hypothetical protein
MIFISRLVVYNFPEHTNSAVAKASQITSLSVAGDVLAVVAVT